VSIISYKTYRNKYNNDDDDGNNSMNIFQKTVFALSAALSFNSRHLLGGVNGATGLSNEVACLPEAPEVCVDGLRWTSPSPGTVCSDDNSCTTSYYGGYSWSYSFVDAIDNSKTGLEVKVYIEDDLTTCKVSVGTETCKMCSADGCEGGIKYDCTNLDNGRSSNGECESLEPILYPFLLKSTTGALTEVPTQSAGGDCPDQHPDIVSSLLMTFGEDNCVQETVSETVEEMKCEHTNPTWFRGGATYRYNRADPNDQYHQDWKPSYLEAYLTYIYGISGIDFLYFDDMDGVGPGGTCLGTSSYLQVIESNRLSPEDGPQCTNAEESFRTGTRKNKKPRFLTCDDVWAAGPKKRARQCRKKKVAKNCPAVCDENDCSCIDNPNPFGRKKAFTCEQLRAEDYAKRTEMCKDALHAENCPSLCGGQYGTFCFAL